MSKPTLGRMNDDLVLEALTPLREAGTLVGVDGIDGQLNEIRRRLATGLLVVAFVGEFKRGKSSLINGLIGEDVLPVDVLPLTTVPTILERGERGCEVRLGAGGVEEHGLEKLAEFVTEAHNPGNRLGIDHVVVRLHAPLVDDGVRLVDTPGVGSVFEHNTRSTTAYLPNVDAAVLVTSADPPISEGEIGFLDEVLEHAVRLFVVLNKADYLDPDQLSRTVAFTEHAVRARVPEWPGPVYPLSARHGVGDPAALDLFRIDLNRFLLEERSATVLQTARRSVQRAVNACRMALELERSAASMTLNELRRHGASFRSVVARLDDDASGDVALLTEAVRRALSDFDDFVARRMPGLRRILDERTIASAEARPGLSPRRLLDALQAERAGLLEGVAGGEVIAARDAALHSFKRAARPGIERVQARMSELQRAVAERFEISLPCFDPAEIELGLERLSFEYPRIPPSTEAVVLSGWRLLGSDKARRRATVKAREQARDELGALFGRLRGLIAQQLMEVARRLAAELGRHQTELASGLMQAIERGTGLLATAEQERKVRARELRQATARFAEVETMLRLEEGVR